MSDGPIPVDNASQRLIDYQAPSVPFSLSPSVPAVAAECRMGGIGAYRNGIGSVSVVVGWGLSYLNLNSVHR